MCGEGGAPGPNRHGRAEREALRARGYTVDHGGRWTYHAFDDWIGASHGYGWRREPIDGPVDYARELQLARYVATGR